MEREASLSSVRAQALKRVRRIILDVIGDGNSRVYLFGSCATGLTRPSSDIDVAIEPLEGSTPGSLANLRERLEESDVPYDVDVIDLSAVSPEFAHRIRHEGVLWNG